MICHQSARKKFPFFFALFALFTLSDIERQRLAWHAFGEHFNVDEPLAFTQNAKRQNVRTDEEAAFKMC